jgi:hypothetical protein
MSVAEEARFVRREKEGNGGEEERPSHGSGDHRDLCLEEEHRQKLRIASKFSNFETRISES